MCVHILFVHSDADGDVGAKALVEPDFPAAAAAARELAPRDHDGCGDLLIDEKRVVFEILDRRAACCAHAFDHILHDGRMHPPQCPIDFEIAVIMVGNISDQGIGAEQTAKA